MEQPLKETKVIEIEGLKATISADFNLIRKAYAELMPMKMKMNSKASEQEIEMDIVGAGDKLLIFGWVDGDEKIKTSPKLRFQACIELGTWLASMLGGDSEPTKKK